MRKKKTTTKHTIHCRISEEEKKGVFEKEPIIQMRSALTCALPRVDVSGCKVLRVGLLFLFLFVSKTSRLKSDYPCRNSRPAAGPGERGPAGGLTGRRRTSAGRRRRPLGRSTAPAPSRERALGRARGRRRRRRRRRSPTSSKCSRSSAAAPWGSLGRLPTPNCILFNEKTQPLSSTIAHFSYKLLELNLKWH